MTKQELNELFTQWDKLNEEYDQYIKNGFKKPQVLEKDQIKYLKNMQKELFELELTWFKVIKGDITIF